MTKNPVAFGIKDLQQQFKDIENTLNMQVKHFKVYIKIERRPGSPPLTPSRTIRLYNNLIQCKFNIIF